MNVTLPYTAAEKAVVSLVGLLGAPILSAFVFFWARRHLPATQNFRDRSYPFYRMMTATLFGQFFGHIGWTGAPYFMAIFAAISFALFEIVWSLSRVFGVQLHSVVPDESQLDEDFATNGVTMERREFLAISPADPETAHTEEMVQSHAIIMKRRQWIVLLLALALGFVALVDGVHLLTSTANRYLLLVSYAAHGISLSLSLYCAMIHAGYHDYAGYRRTWWIGVTLLWCTILFLGILVVLLELPPDVAQSIADHQAFIASYGLAAGLLLALATYFFRIRLSTQVKKDVFRSTIIFVASLAGAMASSIYL
jgi:hypothetical protein